MQIIDNSTRIALDSKSESVVMPILQALDEKLKARFCVEMVINVDAQGNKFLDVSKKKRGGFKRRRKGLLGA